MGLFRKTLGRGYRLARRTARRVLFRVLPPLFAPDIHAIVTVEEDRFLHMLLSRNSGYARASGRVPSPTVSALRAKRLVTWERAGDGFAIAMTPLGFEVAQRHRN